jgi:hypothetical protein
VCLGLIIHYYIKQFSGIVPAEALQQLHLLGAVVWVQPGDPPPSTIFITMQTAAAISTFIRHGYICFDIGIVLIPLLQPMLLQQRL